MYDSNRDAGIKECRAQRETECVRDKGLETSVFTDLDQSAAAVTTNLVGDKTHTRIHTCFTAQFLNKHTHIQTSRT